MIQFRHFLFVLASITAFFAINPSYGQGCDTIALYADFTYERISREVKFRDESHGIDCEASRTWSFGDGNTSTDQHPVHIYAQPGRYLVALDVVFQRSGGQRTNTTTAVIVIPDRPDVKQEEIAVRKDASATTFDLATMYELDATFVSGHTITIIENASFGTSTLNTGLQFVYTPNMGFTGWDAVEFEVFSNTDPTDKDSFFLFIEVYDGDCGLDLTLKSDWHNCPDTCDFGNGTRSPQGQPSPTGTACWGYTFIMKNPTQSDINGFRAIIHLDPNMVFDGAHASATPNSFLDKVSIDTVQGGSRIEIYMSPSETIHPHDEYHLSFNVRVTGDAPRHGGYPGEYHTSFSGNCLGSTKAYDETLSDQEGNACDPNAIHVEPEGCGTNKAIDLDTEHLIYTIEFENVGNDTAFDVRIEDVLPASLDLASIRVLDGYPFQPEARIIPGKSMVRFDFTHANVPPASQDSVRAQGYVKFSVDIKDGLSAGTMIENFADIFFDRQLPVRTDTTTNRLENDPKPVINVPEDMYRALGDTCIIWDATPISGGSGMYRYDWTSGFRSSQLTICPFRTGNFEVYVTDETTGCQTYARWNYFIGEDRPPLGVDGLQSNVTVSVEPNPFVDRASLKIAPGEAIELDVTVVNNLGQTVMDLYHGKTVPGQVLDLSLEGSHLPAGVYFYRLSNEKGLNQSGKIMLTH
ncbi:MAG: PKD domain-containing protein [Bacteroidia bacterium]